MKSYEELLGGTGRTVFFRPERTRARDLVSSLARPTVVIAGQAFPVHDLSMNGLSFWSGEDPSRWVTGDEVAIVLRLHDRDVFAGRARVARSEIGPRQTRVGLGLATGFIDIHEIERYDEEKRLDRDLNLGPDLYTGILPEAYLQAVSRAVTFVQFHRRTLDRHERRYKAMGAGARPHIDALIRKAHQTLSPQWTDIRLAATRDAWACLDDPDRLELAKHYTETVLSSLFLDCPAFRRAYLKPLGYPGDYQVMTHCYASAFEGDSVFAKVFHKIWVELPLPAGVRTRNDFMVEVALSESERVRARDGEGAQFRVTSLGCGPAREVARFTADERSRGCQATWTLLDQDDEALSLAYHDSQRAVAASGEAASVRCLNVSFTQLLNDPALASLADSQHLILCAGIFDYLRESVAQKLIDELYLRLTPGGLIVLGNAIGPNDDFWSPEFVTDWTLLYRTRDEMLRLAARLPSTAEVNVTTEPGRAYYMLTIRKH